MTPTAPYEAAPLLVATAADERYALGACVALASAAACLRGRPAEIVILDCGIRPQTQAAIQRASRQWTNVATMRFLQVPMRQISRFPTPEHFSTAAYARLLLPDLPPGADLLLYLDADVLVRDDVGRLLDGVPADSPIAAVVDFTHPTMAEGLVGPGHPADTGVLMLRLAQWRKDEVGRRALAWLDDNTEHVRYADQDAINAVLGGQVHRIEARWNVQTRPFHEMLRNRHDARRAATGIRAPRVLNRDAGIVHFVGGKPWIGTDLHANFLSFDASRLWWVTLRSTRVLSRLDYIRLAGRAAGRFLLYAQRAWGPRAQARTLRDAWRSLRSAETR